MARLCNHENPSPAVSAGIVLGMLAMAIIPAAIALHSVKTPASLSVVPSASPHGYTWSLLLFLVPIVGIAVWFLPSEGLEIPHRAFWRTIGILGPIGCLLDVVFAQWFFLFPNPQATLGILAPALGRPVPIEEYAFYFTGFIVVLLLYVWLSEYWLAAYSVDDYRAEARALPRLLKFHPTSFILGLALIAAAICYKKYFSSVAEGLPGYFIVLVIGGLNPRRQFLSGNEALHQLARPKPHDVLHPADQHAVGGHAGSALRMVELSACRDDGRLYRRVVRLAARSRIRVAGSNLRHGDHV